MKLVKTDEARAGQRVSRDVVDFRGNLVFPAGTVLTDAALATCKERNVSHLFLSEDSTQLAYPPRDAEFKREALVKDIQRMFTGVDASPLMASLREASKRYLLGKLGGK